MSSSCLFITNKCPCLGKALAIMIQIHKGRKFSWAIFIAAPPCPPIPMIATTRLRAVTMVLEKLFEEGLFLRHLACPRMEPLITLAKQQLRLAKTTQEKSRRCGKAFQRVRQGRGPRPTERCEERGVRQHNILINNSWGKK